MSDAPLTTEERLYSLSKQKLWDHVAQEQHRSMLDSEEYDLWLVATQSCREEIKNSNETIEALKKSLIFYASEASWLDHGFPNGDYLSLATVDKGDHARATLSPKPNEIQRATG